MKSLRSLKPLLLRSRYALILLLVLVLAGGASGITSAQNNLCATAGQRGGIVFDIEYGDTVSNSISNSNYIWGYCFEGEEGDEIRITMEATSGNLDTLVALGDPTLDEVFAQNDDARSGTTDSELEFVLPDDGEYLIIATRFGLDSGSSRGDFDLTLELLSGGGGGSGRGGGGGTPGAASCADVDVDGMQVIEYGDEVDGEITDRSFTQVYCFEGLADDEIVISMTAADELDTLLILSDTALDESFAQNDDIERGNTNSQIEFTLPDDGAYLIVATRYNLEDGRTEGEYTLTLEVTAGPSTEAPPSGGGGGTAAGACADVDIDGVQVIAYGDTVSGEITDDAFVVLYCFEGLADDEIVISMEAARNSELDTLIILTDSTLDNTLAQNDDIERGNTNSQLAFTLPEDGAYLIVATRYNLEEGRSEGDYDLTLELTAGPSADGDTGDDGKDSGGGDDGGGSATGGGSNACESVVIGDDVSFEIMESGDTISGSIDDNNPIRLYCFEGEAGDQVTIRMEASSGDLDPLLILTDPTFEEAFGQNDNISSRNTDAEIVFELPADGVYIIAATRVDVVDGDTAGRFALTLEIEN